MPKRVWWIDKPLLRASSSPSAADLAWFRSRGFRVAVSLLEEDIQRARYDGNSPALAGWSIYPIPIKGSAAASMEQIIEFMHRIPARKKVLVFCSSGLGRSAFMAAAYWIAKGRSANDAIAHVVARAGRRSEWLTKKRRAVLHKWKRQRKALLHNWKRQRNNGKRLMP